MVTAPNDTIQSATAVASDGHSLLVASPAGQTVTALDLADGTRTAIPCACAPTDLTAVGNLFRLNEFGGDPLWLLDTQQDPARIIFVPAAPDPGPAPRFGTRLPAPPSSPSGGFTCGPNSLGVGDRGQQEPARTSHACRNWVECVQSRRLLGLVVAPPGTRRNFVRFGDPPFGRALARENPPPTSASGATRERLLDPVGCPEPPRHRVCFGSVASAPGFHCRRDRGRPSHGSERLPPRLGRKFGRAGV